MDYKYHKDYNRAEEMLVKQETSLTFSILVIALASLFASSPILGNQQALAQGEGGGGGGAAGGGGGGGGGGGAAGGGSFAASAGASVGGEARASSSGGSLVGSSEGLAQEASKVVVMVNAANSCVHACSIHVGSGPTGIAADPVPMPYLLPLLIFPTGCDKDI